MMGVNYNYEGSGGVGSYNSVEADSLLNDANRHGVDDMQLKRR
jgi:hypothetical protein